jgi:glutamyl-tRNA reductase
LPELNAATVLVIGAGDTADLVLRYLKVHAPKQLVIVSRQFDNAVALADKHNADAMALTDLADALVMADVVISATTSTLPVVSFDLMQSVIERRQHKPITMVDIAVPRDIEATVAELPSVHLSCIDDLKTIIQHNLRGREHAAEKAREVIDIKSKEFLAWLGSLDLVATTIRAYRRQIEELSQAELTKAARQLQRGDDPIQVLALFAHAFTNKLLHTPSAQLRQAGVEGRLDILQLAQHLFAIPQSESELL